jgi:hypothetical protein
VDADHEVVELRARPEKDTAVGGVDEDQERV